MKKKTFGRKLSRRTERRAKRNGLERRARREKLYQARQAKWKAEAKREKVQRIGKSQIEVFHHGDIPDSVLKDLARKAGLILPDVTDNEIKIRHRRSQNKGG